MKQMARTALGGLFATLLFASTASTASAACEAPTSTPFSAWDDVNDYVLAPDGDFETPGGWILRGGAALVDGSEPFAATGDVGSRALSLPAGASAVSPPVCLTERHPTFRFFAKADEGDAASLRAQTLAPRRVIALGAVAGTADWAPAPALSTGARNLQIGPDGSVTVRFRLTADRGAWQVDDVFVDPQKWG